MNNVIKSSHRIAAFRPFFGTLCFYALFIGLGYWANRISPSGPCTPGLGFLVLMLLPVISSVLLIVTLVSVAKGRKPQILPAMVHGIVIMAFICMLCYSHI
jgi:hypothetical protein